MRQQNARAVLEVSQRLVEPAQGHGEEPEPLAEDIRVFLLPLRAN